MGAASRCPAGGVRVGGDARPRLRPRIADSGRTHRSAGALDLLVAATAELHRLVLLRYDRDLQQIGEVTGQPHQWLAEPGSLP